MSPSCGVVGLGAMGRPIAEHLVAAHVPTTVLDLDAEMVEHLTAKGAKAASSLPQIAEASDVVFVIVPTDDDVRRVCLGEQGLLAGARPGSVVVINASVTPATCEAIAAAAGQRDVDVLDAALTGGVRGAENGQINLLVGGEESVIDRIRPLLDPWTVGVHHLGPLGSGQVGKTVNNLIHWGEIAIIYESLLLGQRLGVPPSKMRPALLAGTTASRTLAEIEQMRFTWWKKDIENAERMAEPISYGLPLTERVYELMPGITGEGVTDLLADRDPQARPTGDDR